MTSSSHSNYDIQAFCLEPTDKNGRLRCHRKKTRIWKRALHMQDESRTTMGISEKAVCLLVAEKNVGASLDLDISR